MQYQVLPYSLYGYTLISNTFDAGYNWYQHLLCKGRQYLSQREYKY